MSTSGIDIRQTADRIIFDAFLTDTVAAIVTTGTTELRVFELQDDGTLKVYDWTTNDFVATGSGTPDDETTMTHQQRRDSSGADVDTGLWTAVLATLTNWTIGNVYYAEVYNAAAAPTIQIHKFQFGMGDKLFSDGCLTADAFAADALAAATFATDCLTSDALADGTITAAKLGADCITAAKIADDAFTADHFADDCFPSAVFATGCFTADAFAADALVAATFATGCFTSDVFGADCLTSAAFADDCFPAAVFGTGCLTADAFAADALAAATFATDCLTSDALADGTITAAKLGADCITAAKIADDAFTADHFADDCFTAAMFDADLSVIQARVIWNPNEAAEVDEYHVEWFKDGVPVGETDITLPKIHVYAWDPDASDTTELIAETAMEWDDSDLMLRYLASDSERNSSGAALQAIVKATIDGTVHTRQVPVHRDR